MADDTLFARIGGQIWFDALIDRFYAQVELDPVLRPLYPDDLEPGKRHLALFLGQYWGGPQTYSELRGHPRLRARHLPFTIGQAERDAWIDHMMTALHEVEASTGALDPEDREALTTYLRDTASFLVNQGPLTLRP